MEKTAWLLLWQLSKVDHWFFTTRGSFKHGIRVSEIVKKATIAEKELVVFHPTIKVHAQFFSPGIIIGKSGLGHFAPVARIITNPLVVEQHFAGYGASFGLEVLQKGMGRFIPG